MLFLVIFQYIRNFVHHDLRFYNVAILVHCSYSSTYSTTRTRSTFAVAFAFFFLILCLTSCRSTFKFPGMYVHVFNILFYKAAYPNLKYTKIVCYKSGLVCMYIN